jgi:hypothetical protein
MQNWKKPKVLKEGVDYAFIEFKDSDLTGVQVLKGNYEGVVYHYHKARVVEDNGFARLQFGFTIVHPGKYDIDLLQNDEGFVTIMGDILQQLVLNKAKADEQIRTDNSEEFNLQ